MEILQKNLIPNCKVIIIFLKGYGKQDILFEDVRRLLPLSGRVFDKQRVLESGGFGPLSLQSK